MLPTLFSVFLDYKCNFWCDHCSVGSSPRTVLPMSRELLDKFLDELPAVETAAVVAFTGGEATMRWDELVYAIGRVKEARMVSRLVTNGWWAKSPARAVGMTRELKKAGLDELSTSFDDFHEPFIGLSEIANLLRAGMEEDLRLALGVIVDKDARWDAGAVTGELARLLAMTEDELNDKVRIIYDYATPAGTGSTLDISGLDGGDKLDYGCAEVMRTISVHPTGQVKACCGHAMFYEPDLTIGSLKEESLADILDRAQHNVLYWWIHTVGPKRILDRLGVEGTYASICHACQVLLRDHREKLREFAVAHKNEIVTNDVLLADGLKRVAGKLIATEDDIRRQVRHGR